MSNSETLRVGVLSLARPTFDVPFADQVSADAWNLLEKIPVNWIGSRELLFDCLLYTSPSPRDATLSRMPSSA